MRFLYLTASLVLLFNLSCAGENGLSGETLEVPLATKLAVCEECSSDAAQLARKLAEQGFMCNYGPVDSSRGYRCRDWVGDYPLPINIFIPPSLNATLPLTIAYHFHRWWPTPAENPLAGEDGDFGKFLADSRANTILIVPESSGRNETYLAALNTAPRMNTFLNAVEDRLALAGLRVRLTTPRLISGHSGAYVILSSMGRWASDDLIPRLQTLKGVALLNSAYRYRTGLVEFMNVLCANESSIFLLAYNPVEGGDSKKETNLRIYDEVTSSKGCANTEIVHATDSNLANAAFPKKYLSEFLKQASQSQVSP